MHFVIFTLLFTGVCLAAPQQLTQSDDLLGSAGSLVTILPALIGAAGGLQAIGDNTTELAGKINESNDASPVLFSFANVLSKSSPILPNYARANQDLSDSIKKITGKTITNVDLLKLTGVKEAVNGIEVAEYAVSSIFSDTIVKIGTFSGFSGDLSQQAKDIDSVIIAKRDLTNTVKNLKGISGSAFKAVVIAGGVVVALKNSANGIGKLATAIQSKISDANGVDFSSVILSLKNLSDVENELANAVNDLIDLGVLL